MKYDPFDNILSNKAKKLKKTADERPYFENTHDTLGLYKNPKPKEKEEEEEIEKTGRPNGMALLRRIYGGAMPTDPTLYSKAKQIADKTYSKPSAYKSGFIQKKYKEMGGKYKDDGERPLERWFEEDWRDIGNKQYPVYRPTKRVSKKTPLTATEIDSKQAVKQIALKQKIKGKSNLPPFKGGVIPCNTSCKKKVKGTYKKAVENWASNYPNEMTKDIKRVNELHLTPANKVTGHDPLYQVSNPRKTQQLAFEIYGKDAIVYKSDKPNKKYQILNPTGKFIYFGQMKPPMEDYLKHQDKERRRRYIARASKIKGNWRNDPYSPNFLSLVLLWNADLSEII